jgi:hypothetical protein
VRLSSAALLPFIGSRSALMRNSVRLLASAAPRLNGRVGCSARIAGDVGLQLMDGGGLSGNDPVDEIADRNDAEDVIVT